MKYNYRLVAPFKSSISISGFFSGLHLAYAYTKNYFQHSNKDFAGYRAYLMYRYWEANQITDQV